MGMRVWVLGEGRRERHRTAQRSAPPVTMVYELTAAEHVGVTVG
jgi:hypothetical protein